MCFSSPKPPDTKTPPTPSPSPTPIESQTGAAVSSADRRKKLQQSRFGLASTIKTSASGVTSGTASLLSPELTGKKKLGE